MDKAWRNESKGSLHTHTDTFTSCVIQLLMESQHMGNVAPFIDEAANVFFYEQANKAQFGGESGSISSSSPRPTALGSANFLQFCHTHAWTKKKKSKRLLHLHYLLAPSLNLLVWYCLGGEKTWLREVWIRFIMKLFATSVGVLCCCTGTPGGAKLFCPK